MWLNFFSAFLLSLGPHPCEDTLALPEVGIEVAFPTANWFLVSKEKEFEQTVYHLIRATTSAAWDTVTDITMDVIVEDVPLGMNAAQYVDYYPIRRPCFKQFRSVKFNWGLRGFGYIDKSNYAITYTAYLKPIRNSTKAAKIYLNCKNAGNPFIEEEFKAIFDAIKY